MLTQFIKKRPLGLYRGEAWSLLAYISLEFESDLKNGMKAYSKVIEWVRKARHQDEKLKEFAVPEQSLEVTAAPKDMRNIDGWGNVAWSQPQATALVNRLNTPWYLDRLLMDAHTQRSLIYFMVNKGDRSLYDLQCARELDPIDNSKFKGGSLSNFARLRDGFATGRLYATEEEIELFPIKIKLSLLRAEISFETEKWDEAIQAYDRITERFKSDLSKEAMSYLNYARASAFLFKGNVSKGEKILLTSFVNNKRAVKNITWARAMIAMANIKQKEDPQSWLLKALNTTKNKELRADILLTLGQYLFLSNDLDKAHRVFNKLQSAVKDNDYRHKAASQYLVAINGRSKQNNVKE